jgi:hypothetical protein
MVARRLSPPAGAGGAGRGDDRPPPLRLAIDAIAERVGGGSDLAQALTLAAASRAARAGGDYLRRHVKIG